MRVTYECGTKDSSFSKHQMAAYKQCSLFLLGYMLPTLNVSEIDRWSEFHKHLIHVAYECSKKR
jgi:hypothetical protein